MDDVISIVREKPSRHLLQPSEFSWSTHKLHHGIPWHRWQQPILDSIWTSIYRKPTLTERYLDWNSNHVIPPKKSTVHALLYRVTNQRNGLPPPSTSQKQLPKLDHPRTRKETSNPHNKPRNWSESKENILISVPYVPGLSEQFWGIFHHTNVQVVFKGTNTQNPYLSILKMKSIHNLKQNSVYKWSCLKESSILHQWIQQISRNKVKEHSMHWISVVLHTVNPSTAPVPTSPTSK